MRSSINITLVFVPSLNIVLQFIKTTYCSASVTILSAHIFVIRGFHYSQNGQRHRS